MQGEGCAVKFSTFLKAKPNKVETPAPENETNVKNYSSSNGHLWPDPKASQQSRSAVESCSPQWAQLCWPTTKKMPKCCCVLYAL